MRFFLDNCISPVHARALRVLAEVQEYEIVHLSEKFARDTPDAEWLRTLGEEGDWVVVSGDVRITRGKAEKRAWHESGLTAFFFGKGWASRGHWKLAADLVGWWSTIVLTARTHPHGRGFLVPVRGKDLKRIYP